MQSCHKLPNWSWQRDLICGNFESRQLDLRQRVIVWNIFMNLVFCHSGLQNTSEHRPQNLSRHSQCLNILYIRTFQFCRSSWFFELGGQQVQKATFVDQVFARRRKRDCHWSINIVFTFSFESEQTGAAFLCLLFTSGKCLILKL